MLLDYQLLKVLQRLLTLMKLKNRLLKSNIKIVKIPKLLLMSQIVDYPTIHIEFQICNYNNLEFNFTIHLVNTSIMVLLFYYYGYLKKLYYPLKELWCSIKSFSCPVNVVVIKEILNYKL